MNNHIQKVLVIEDEPSFEILIDSAMNEQGFQYDWFVRAQETPAGISFMRMNGTTEIVDLSNYWVALCDSQLKGSAMQGIEVTRSLASMGMPVVAISGDDSLNNMMVNTGALFGIRKDRLWFELYEGKIQLPELVETATSRRRR
jgi:DNA-binding response OmpR family regulator